MSSARFQTLDLGDFAIGPRGEIRHRLGASRRNSFRGIPSCQSSNGSDRTGDLAAWSLGLAKLLIVQTSGGVA
jgi:hypothetical protein